MIRWWRESRDWVGTRLLQIGSVGALAGAGYLIWGGLKGFFVNPIDPARVAAVVGRLDFFLYLCGWAIALGLLCRLWDWRPIGVVMLFSAVAFWFILPIVFVILAGAENPLSLRGGQALRALLTPSLIVGFGQGIYAAIDFWRTGPTWRWKAKSLAQLIFVVRETEKRVRPRRRLLTPLSPCWKLPVVDKIMCDNCPVYQRRKPCWRLKGGCQCNPLIVDALLGNLTEKMGLTVSSFSTASLMTWKKGEKPPCHRCAIYLLHQQIKYDWMAPVLFFAPPVLLYLFWDAYLTGYQKATAWLTQLWIDLAFAPAASPDPLGLSNPLLVGYVAFVLCALSMVYGIRFLEWVIFGLNL
ncbi:MAG: hypothetical protein NZ959_02330 [Armatimonadetes bacterium]|nr:hypothetical protein [Armatimonadota bacterium]MDW8120988.1 hypothetical protein [Armatimonadota bacterium]